MVQGDIQGVEVRLPALMSPGGGVQQLCSESNQRLWEEDPVQVQPIQWEQHGNLPPCRAPGDEDEQQSESGLQ